MHRQRLAQIGQVDFPENHPATFFACPFTFAHRFFAALEIAALPAADNTRFFAPFTSTAADLED
jgi:hypothetical protein